MGTRGEERLETITSAATEAVTKRGYYDMIIQEVSDRVGITQAGPLKYVKNKGELLTLAPCRYEDSSEAEDYIQGKLAFTPEQRELSSLPISKCYQVIAEGAMKRLQLTQPYLVLRAEAINPNHSAYEYYAQRGGRLCAQVGSYPWRLPSEYSTPQKVGLLLMYVGSVMEGLQPH